MNGDARSISTDVLSENNVFWFVKKADSSTTELIGIGRQTHIRLDADSYDISFVAKDANNKINTKVVRIVIR